MAITEVFSGSTSISTAEYWLAAGSTTQGSGQSTDGVYQLFVDISTLAAGDVFRIEAYDAARSSDTSREIFKDFVSGPPDSGMYVTPSFILMHKWDFSITKISGTDRTLQWSIRQVA
jgi:hypothetical protein